MSRIVTKGYGRNQKIITKGFGKTFKALVTEIINGVSQIWQDISGLSRLWK